MIDPHRPKVVFINRSYWPDIEATGQLLTDLCEFLADKYDVHVICGQPNQAADGVTYRRKGVERHNNVTIHRLEHSQIPKGRRLGRIANLVSFTVATSYYLRKNRLTADIFVSETDPFLLPPVVNRHARRMGCRFMSYLQDIYPDVAIAVDQARDGGVTRAIRRRLLAAYKMADRVVVLGEDMRDRLVGWGVPEEKLAIVPNWVDCDAIVPVKQANPFRHRHQLEDSFVVMHSGNMGLTQQLHVVIEATRSPNWPLDAVLVLVGNGADRRRLESQAETVTPGRVRFLPYQPREALSESLSAADLHLVSMDERITGCLFPSKFYGILASATPVLVIAPPASEPARIVHQEGLGWTCPPGDPEAIASAVARSRISSDYQEQGYRARRLAEEKYDRTVSCRIFSALLADTLLRCPVPVSNGGLVPAE